MMKVYQVIGWDSMASSMCDEYLAGTYESEADALAAAAKLNDMARASWMANCSPAGRANYRDQAHVRVADVHPSTTVRIKTPA